MWKRSLLLLVPLVLVQACASSSYTQRTPHKAPKQHQRTTFDRSHIPKSDVPLVANDRVVAWVDYFTGANKDRFGRYLKRSGRYTPMMKQILKEYGLPQDLIYVAMIESGFTARATSTASAVGFWQFIRATGSRYGLDQNAWVDERRDAEKSTHAAAQYLRDLYNEFGDWYLAMAAYNSGEGTVRRAIRRYGTKNFWELADPRKDAFKAETRDYVPKFIAAAIIAKNPAQFGLENVVMDSPVDYEFVVVDTPTDVEVIARCAGADPELIADLNSELKMGTTPPNYKVKLPVGTTKRFQVALARIPNDERASNRMVAVAQRHQVGKHDTIKSIARQYGVSPASILAANDLRSAKSIRRGMSLSIPGSANKSTMIARASRKASSMPVMVTVKRGDSLQSIAKKYDLSENDLKEWNQLSGRRPSLKTGQEIALRAPDTTISTTTTTVVQVDEVQPEQSTRKLSKKELAKRSVDQDVVVVVEPPQISKSGYVVLNGDSWNTVSQNIGVPTSRLKALNPQITAQGLHVGDVLSLSEESTVVVTSVTTTTGEVIAPVVAARAVSKKAVHAAPSAHKVRSGDTLEKIADRYGVSVSDLRAWNHLSKGRHIQVGQKLVISGGRVANTVDKSSKRENVGQTKKKSKSITYKVRPGDNLWTIGKKHNLSPDQIKTMNSLKHGMVKPGDILTLRRDS